MAVGLLAALLPLGAAAQTPSLGAAVLLVAAAVVLRRWLVRTQ